jgi:uncharacterized protein YbjQ (UPF0145 family)
MMDLSWIAANEDLLELVIQAGMFAFLMTLGFCSGTWLEKRHYRSIKDREAKTLNCPALPMSWETLVEAQPDGTEALQVTEVRFVSGVVVLSDDYFKAFLGSLKTFFGGHLTSYESLLDRARREAVLRMKAQAPDAHMIVDVRLEPVSIGKESTGKEGGPTSIEMMAHGTAIYLKAG